MIIVKVGGGAEINLEGIAADLTRLTEAIVVLGANSTRDALAERLAEQKIVITSVSGYESVFSDNAAVELLMMAYAGLRATKFVEMCQRRGVNAISLSGLDGRLVQGKRNTGIRVRENGKTLIKRDLSGKPQAVNHDLLRLLIGKGYVPVITVPIIDEDGFAINSENDDIVARLHEALCAQKVIQLIEAPGFLADKDDPTSLIAQMAPADLSPREETCTGRMKRKLLALRRLFESGRTQVYISDGRTTTPLSDALAGKGTVIE